MKYRTFYILIIGALIGFVLTLSLRGCITGPNNTPEIGGQEVPKTNFVIDFNKRYNIVYSQYQQATRIYENCKILGYTGQEVKETSGKFSKGYSFFDHWLVAERTDGRKVYFQTNGITSLEEAELPQK